MSPAPSPNRTPVPEAAAGVPGAAVELGTAQRWRMGRAARRTRRTGAGVGLLDSAGLVVFVLILVFAFVGPHFAPHEPRAQDLGFRLGPTFWEAGGTTDHLLGTDQLGRDVFSRLIESTRTSLIIAMSAAVLEAMIGISLGLMAGFWGGWPERIVMRWADVQLGFPSILLLMTILLVVGVSIPTLIVAIAVNGWMIFARVTRATVQGLRVEPAIEGVVALGARSGRIILRHILPRMSSTLASLTVLEVARIVLAESAISFIGIGVQPPNLSLGLMLAGGRNYLSITWGLATFPGAMILVIVLSLNLAVGRVQAMVDRK
jgi:ABC-type dipeptide/oligopeptide/nickel transport system permease subunit